MLFSDNVKQISVVYDIAAADDHNKYYLAKGDLLNSQPAGTVKIFRSFDEEATFNSEDFKKLKKWISRSSRPLLFPFDDRTVQTIFG